MEDFLIPACFAIPIAAAALILYIHKMSGKGDEKKSKKKDKIGSKSDKKGKFDAESKGSKPGSSESTDVPVAAIGKMSEASLPTAMPSGPKSSATAKEADQPPSKPKRRGKGKNTVAAELENCSKQPSADEMEHLTKQTRTRPEDETMGAKESISAEDSSPTSASKSTEKRNKKKMTPSKSVDQPKQDQPRDTSTEDRKSSLPKSTVDKTDAEAVNAAKTIFKPLEPKSQTKVLAEEPKPPIRKVEPKSPKSQAAPEPPKPHVLPQLSKSQATPAPPEDQAAPQPSESKAPPQPPKSKAAPESPKSKAAPEPPKSKAAPEPPKSKAAPEPPKSKAAPEPPKSKATPEPPKSKTMSDSPKPGNATNAVNAKDEPQPPIDVKGAQSIPDDIAAVDHQVRLTISEPSTVGISQQEPRKLAGFVEKSCAQSKHITEPNTMDEKPLTPASPKSAQTQVRVLTLNSGDNHQGTLYRLQKGFILQIRPGPSLFGKKTNVFTNCPKSLCESFERTKYRKLQWQSDSLNRGDDTALFVEIQMQSAGSFHFYLTLEDCTEKDTAVASGYFLVDPVLTRGANGEVLPLDCVQCETFMVKNLGTLDRWTKTLQVAKEAGYNMIHFTPIQELGASRSGYSLRDQLKLNPECSPKGKECTVQDVKKIVDMMNNEWKMISITDIVLNHTANESSWIVEHPECTYNLVNSPHLRPAYVLDRVIWHFTMEIIAGKWASKGIPKELLTEDHVKALRHVLHTEVMHKHKIEEYYLLGVDSLMEQFRSKVKSRRRPSLKASLLAEDVEIIPDPSWRRFKSTVDLDLAVRQFNVSWADTNEADRLDECCRRFRSHLEQLNSSKATEIRNHISSAVNCIIGAVQYERLQWDGPKIKSVSVKHPLVPLYFTHYGKESTVEEEEEASFGPNANYLMGHNGWVAGDDPLKNFAAAGSNVYLRREINAWGDSVKLRFGDKPEDCPYLWDHMRRYVEETARVFHGIRLDNCHSTPIHVAEYLLDCARRIRPNLYVIAELFTASDRTDNIFVNRLGISSLVREAMSAPNSHEEGRLVYRCGGEPVGAFLLPPVRPLVPSIAHAMFLHVTHDNRSPCHDRSAWDLLPSNALVSMACCASGGTRGYDEIVPHQIHVVKEERKYRSWTDDAKPQRGTVNASSGVLRGKRILNDLHYDLGAKGFSQVYVDQVTEDIVTVTRHNPVTHESVVLVAYTAFRPPAQINNGHIRPLTVQGKVEEILFEMKVTTNNDKDRNRQVPGDYVRDADYINGVDDFTVEVSKSVQPKDSTFVKQLSPEGADTSVFQYTGKFTPGSVIAFKLSLLSGATDAIGKIRSLLSDFGYKQKISEIENCNKNLLEIVRQLSLCDLNRILYRCEQEERDEGRGWGSYNVPNLGSFTYCGLQGIISVMGDIRVSNDLGHPICGNLRDGNWMMDYIVGRLKLESTTRKFACWLEDQFRLLKKIPKYLIPAYFDAVITAVYLTLINHAWSSMSKFISAGSGFAKALSLCSVQFCGVVKSALLPRLSPNLFPPHPPKDVKPDKTPIDTSITISAGLPHFSVGYMRNWGRDTFIALPGNLLVTGRFDEARWIILAFAGTLRHGLIPNLLDGGAKARFNCRDSVWFWLYSIQRYVNTAPGGHQILKDEVSRLFPDDNSEPLQPGKCDQPLENVIQEALQRHFEGVKFRERNAGIRIDSQMTDAGFNNQIGVDLETGFPYGGNENNCGTWMDKMGSSAKAGNKGKPATPRDGSAVEIVGLCKATVRFLAQMHIEGKYSFGGVSRKDSEDNEIKWSYKFWDNVIKESFEKHFWVNSSPDAKNEKTPDLVNRRGIYKDTVGATQPWADFQLRCNFPIALAVAPELVSTENGKIALAQAEEILLGPVGMKTLDSKDWAYRGDYDNSNDGIDSSVAHGFNYHQGPEWLWPVGWFLRAKLAVASGSGSREAIEEAVSQIKYTLAASFTHLLSTPWRSLPELTNRNGTFCPDSNPAQAWSTGCLLEVLWEMNQIGEKLHIQT